MFVISKKVIISMVVVFLSTNLFASRYSDADMSKKRYDKFQNQYSKYDQYKYSEHQKLNNTILELSDKLLLSSRIDTSDFGEIAITSFVDLHKLNKTTHFGRTLSESLFDELFIRGFNVSELRGQKTLSVNSNGEYYITRDVNLLDANIPNKYILVGTYTMVEDSILINARIVDNKSGRIVASARSYYNSDDCRLLENCKKPRKIKIITDGCSTVGCSELKKSISYNNYTPKSLASVDQTSHFNSTCIDVECTKNKVTYDSYKRKVNNHNTLSLIK